MNKMQVRAEYGKTSPRYLSFWPVLVFFSKKRIGRLQLKMTFCGNFRIQTPRLRANLSSTNDRQVQPGLRANQVLERILQPITRKYIRTVQ